VRGARVIYDVDSVAVPEQAVVRLRRRGPLCEIGADPAGSVTAVRLPYAR